MGTRLAQVVFKANQKLRILKGRRNGSKRR